MKNIRLIVHGIVMQLEYYFYDIGMIFNVGNYSFCVLVLNELNVSENDNFEMKFSPLTILAMNTGRCCRKDLERHWSGLNFNAKRMI